MAVFALAAGTGSAQADPPVALAPEEFEYARIEWKADADNVYRNLALLREDHGLSVRWIDGLESVLRIRRAERVAVLGYAASIPIVASVRLLEPDAAAKIPSSTKFERQRGRFGSARAADRRTVVVGSMEAPVPLIQPGGPRVGAVEFPGEVIGRVNVTQDGELPTAEEVANWVKPAIEAKVGIVAGAALPRKDGWKPATATSVPSAVRLSQVLVVAGLRGRIDPARNRWERFRCEVIVTVLHTREVLVQLRCRGWFTTVTDWNVPLNRYEDIEAPDPSESGWPARLDELVRELVGVTQSALDSNLK